MDEHEFGTALSQVVSPSQPVQTIEHLFGRDNELDRIRKALYAPGRHAFIYGERGVGKSSLAATAANQVQSSDASYIDTSAGPGATLASVVANIAYQVLQTSRLKESRISTSASLQTRYLSLSQSWSTTEKNLLSEIHSILDATEILREAASLHSERPVVVIDEFDRMEEPERAKFADLLKQLGDKKVPIKFIFTGVADSMQALLGAHPSSIRQLDTIDLPRLSWEGRDEILRFALRRFGLSIDRNIALRIAAVSDGFPYYVHLMTEKILWAVYESTNQRDTVTWDHYDKGLRVAIESVHAELRTPYEKAAHQQDDNYEEIMWSTADSEYLHRNLKEMYASYVYIMKHREDRGPLDYDRYTDRIRKLREEKYGAILVSEKKKPGLYWYREKMLRGYVRMQSEANGIALVGEADAGQQARQYMHVPSSANRGYRTSSVPRGVHMSRQRQHPDEESNNEGDDN